MTETVAGPRLIVKKAGADDPNDALALIEEYYESIGVIARDDRSTLLRLLSDRTSGIWIAYIDSVPSGCVLLRPLPTLSSAAEVKRLYVRPSGRGLGVASRLLKELEEFAGQQGVSELYLDTMDDLIEAISFYERHGYQRCARYNENPQANIFMRKQLSPVVVRTFLPGDEFAFRSLNEAWIVKYFRLEAKDHETLEDPGQYILSRGGQIFMAIRKDERVGCCALLALEDGSFEIGKMAVAEALRGRGIGRLLLEHVIAFSRAHSIPRLYLETNSALTGAIHLYESVGFRLMPPDRVTPSPYKRADTHMEMFLD